MTTIAWDGKVLAADSLVTSGTTKVDYQPKVFRLEDGRLVGFSGALCHSKAFIDWLNGKTDTAPKGDYSAIVVSLDGKARRYDDGDGFFEATGHYAIGSGADFALAAMHCGKSAEEAVAVARDLDVYTGGRVWCLALNPAKPAKTREELLFDALNRHCEGLHSPLYSHAISAARKPFAGSAP